MLKAIEAYLDLRRATGFAMSNAEYLLKSFAAFAAERGQTHVHAQTAIDWAALGPSVAQRDARLKSVCRFVRHVQVEDGRHELPPANHFGAHKRRRPPHIYSDAEFNCLIEAALRLGPKGGLRSLTYASLLALLSATGLRISEALKLTIADVTRDGLLIRETKFRKTRLVPLHDTAVTGLGDIWPVAGLARTMIRCSSTWRPAAALYCRQGDLRQVGPQGRDRTDGEAPPTPARSATHVRGARAAGQRCRPKPKWPAHMAALSTYMGHVNIYATYWYLEATADLMRDVAAAGEDYVFDGRRS